MAPVPPMLVAAGNGPAVPAIGLGTWGLQGSGFELEEDEMRRISALARPDGRIVDPAWGPTWD